MSRTESRRKYRYKRKLSELEIQQSQKYQDLLTNLAEAGLKTQDTINFYQNTNLILKNNDQKHITEHFEEFQHVKLDLLANSDFNIDPFDFNHLEQNFQRILDTIDQC